MKAIIIGAGVSGLAAGSYLRMNGIDAEIFEMHNISGGVCTSWKREEYLFDHCLHWVMGINKKSSMYPYYKDFGVLDEIEFHQADIVRKIILDDKIFNVYTDANKLEEELINFFPNEKKAIKTLIKKIIFFSGFYPPMDADFAKIRVSDILKMIPFIPSLLKLMRISIKDYLGKTIKNDDLRNLIFKMFPIGTMPAIMTIISKAYYHRKEGGYPIGGSLNFARIIEKKFLNLGGKINFNKKVKKIIIENNKAIGIETSDGEKYFSDIVISASDAKEVLFDMLEGKYLTSIHKKMFGSPSLWPPLICISIGVDMDFSNEAEIVNFKTKNKITINNKSVEWLGFFNFSRDKHFAPSGKSVIEIQIETDYHYWKNLYDNNKVKYENEKKAILDFCVEEIENLYSGFKNKIEATDVATPVTWENYTGNWQGSFEGWLPNIKIFGKGLPKKLPGLKNFYMTGQWTFPGGGIPLCIVNGKKIASMIKKDHK